MLLGALALAASILHTGTRAGQVGTLYTSPPNRTIAAFAQDGDLVSWFAPAPSPKGCNEVWLWQLGSVRQPLPREGATNHNVTCGWQVPAGSPVGLAVAANGGSPALLWTLHEAAAQALKFDYVIGATVADPIERRFQEVAHASHGAGQWLGGVAGSGTTLVYAVAEVAYKDQLACLSTPKEAGACDLKVMGGGIYRVVGRKAPLRIDQAPPSVAVATSGSDVAYIPASGAATADGRPLAALDASVDVRDVATGSIVTSISPDTPPVAVGLSNTVLAVLGRSSGRLVLSWYDSNTGKQLGTLRLPPGAAPMLSVSDSTIVFRVGRSIRVVAVHGKRVRTVARATATPIGLSITGSRIAWAENVGGRGRIRAITLASP